MESIIMDFLLSSGNQKCVCCWMFFPGKRRLTQFEISRCFFECWSEVLQGGRVDPAAGKANASWHNFVKPVLARNCIAVCVLTLNLVSVYHIQQERNEYHRAHMVNLRQKEVFCVFLCHLVWFCGILTHRLPYARRKNTWNLTQN